MRLCSVDDVRRRSARPCVENLEGRRLLTVWFGSPRVTPTGDGPRQIALADFDGDDRLDLAVAASKGHRVEIRLGRGDGTFGEATGVVSGPSPAGVTAADLNADGATDLIVTSFEGASIGVLLGHGDGTFAAPASYEARGGPRSSSVGDLDGDGIVDIAVGNQGYDVSIYKGHGDGTFDPQRTFVVTDQSNDIGMADLNGDGAMDLYMPGYFDLHIALNDGEGGFSLIVSHFSGGGGYAVDAADVNGDGHIDIVDSNNNNNYVSVFLGDGTGDFSGRYRYSIDGSDPDLSTGNYPYGVEFADLDLDGKMEMVAVSNRSVSVWPGTGDGTFPTWLEFSLGLGGQELAVGDVNGDGLRDLVSSDFDRDVVRVLLNGVPDPVSVGLSADAVIAAEGGSGGTTVPVIVRLSNPVAQTVTVHYATGGGSAVAGDDYLPADGIVTFAPGATEASFNVTVVGNDILDGTRTIGLSLDSPVGATLGLASGSIVIEDDEQPSVFSFQTASIVVEPSADTATVTVVRGDASSTGVSVNYATVDGTALAGRDFQAVSGTLTFEVGQTSISFTIPILANPQSRDGSTFDVLLSAPVGGTIAAPSTATVVLTAAPIPPPPPRWVPGDYDGDDTADLATFTYDGIERSGRFDLRLSAGGTRTVFLGAIGDVPISGDFDGDRIGDVAVFRPDVDTNGDGISDSAAWTVLRSSDGQRWTLTFGAPGLMDLPAPADYDGDGLADLAVFRPVSDLVPGAAEWFIRSSATGAGMRLAFGAAAGMDLPAPADYDGDGRADVATFRPNSDLVPGAAQWFILPSATNRGLVTMRDAYQVTFGQAGGHDLPIPADYDGDGRADIAAFRSRSDLADAAGSADWFISRSGSNSGLRFTFGKAGSIATPADYDGDGQLELGNFDQTVAAWAIRELNSNDHRESDFGVANSVPVLAPLASRLAFSIGASTFSENAARTRRVPFWTDLLDLVLGEPVAAD